MPNSSCIWRQMYYWIFKRRRWWRWRWLTSFYVTGNKLKEPPIKTNEPGPYFGFGVNQSSEPVTAYQTTMMVLVLVAIWHWEDCCHPSRHKWSFRASLIIFEPASFAKLCLGLKPKHAYHCFCVKINTLFHRWNVPKENVCTSNVFLLLLGDSMRNFLSKTSTYYYLS